MSGSGWGLILGCPDQVEDQSCDVWFKLRINVGMSITSWSLGLHDSWYALLHCTKTYDHCFVLCWIGWVIDCTVESSIDGIDG